MGKIKVFPRKIRGNKSEIDILLFFFIILSLHANLHQNTDFIDKMEHFTFCHLFIISRSLNIHRSLIKTNNTN
jgi:hypothetical protein